MEDNYREVKKAEPCLKLIHMDQVEVEEIEWLFYPFIPYGKVTIIQGDPGEGKTTVVLQIIAKLTKGEAILSETSEGKSEETGVPINVIYQTAEDGLGDTIKPRLLAAGADCSRVLVIDDQDQPLTMVDARLEEAIIQTKARLVVLDPIQSFLGAGVDMHRANEIRPLMKRISVLAEKYQCAIILIGHMNKNSNGKSSYSKYLELKSKNQKLSDRNLDLENRVDRLREEVSVIKKENVALLNVSYDMDRVVAVLGKNKVKEAIEVAKHLEQANAKQNIKKKRIDRDGR